MIVGGDSIDLGGWLFSSGVVASGVCGQALLVALCGFDCGLWGWVFGCFGYFGFLGLACAGCLVLWCICRAGLVVVGGWLGWFWAVLCRRWLWWSCLVFGVDDPLRIGGRWRLACFCRGIVWWVDLFCALMVLFGACSNFGFVELPTWWV